MRYLIILLLLTGCGILESSNKDREIVSDTLKVSAVSIGQDKFDNDSDTLRASIYGVYNFNPANYDSLFVDVIGKDDYPVVAMRERGFTVIRKRTRPYEIVKDDSLYFYIKL